VRDPQVLARHNQGLCLTHRLGCVRRRYTNLVEQCRHFLEHTWVVFPSVDVIELGKKIELSRDPIPLPAPLSKRAAKSAAKFEVRETLERAVERRSALAIKCTTALDSPAFCRGMNHSSSGRKADL